MTIGLIVLLVILICVVALIGRINNIETDEMGLDEKLETSTNEDIQEQFFESVRNGKEKIKFLKLRNQFDLMFIKSLFQSENIPYYLEFEKMSKIRPGMNIGALGSFCLLYILKDDYYDAIKVVENYKNKKQYNNNNDVNDNIRKNSRNITEIFFGNWTVPSAKDIDGIEIINNGMD